MEKVYQQIGNNLTSNIVGYVQPWYSWERTLDVSKLPESAPRNFVRVPEKTIMRAHDISLLNGISIPTEKVKMMCEEFNTTLQLYENTLVFVARNNSKPQLTMLMITGNYEEDVKATASKLNLSLAQRLGD